MTILQKTLALAIVVVVVLIGDTEHAPGLAIDAGQGKIDDSDNSSCKGEGNSIFTDKDRSMELSAEY